MPRSYSPELRRRVSELARSDTRVKQLAVTFGMAEVTIHNWLKQGRIDRREEIGETADQQVNARGTGGDQPLPSRTCSAQERGQPGAELHVHPPDAHHVVGATLEWPNHVEAIRAQLNAKIDTRRRTSTPEPSAARTFGSYARAKPFRPRRASPETDPKNAASQASLTHHRHARADHRDRCRGRDGAEQQFSSRQAVMAPDEASLAPPSTNFRHSRARSRCLCVCVGKRSTGGRRLSL
jgi:transposase-like protein